MTILLLNPVLKLLIILECQLKTNVSDASVTVTMLSVAQP